MASFQRLDVYQCAIKFLALCRPIRAALPRGQGDLGDQLRRASRSIVLNIAEAEGRRGADRAHAYNIARGSATECIAILDVCRLEGFIQEMQAHEGQELLDRVISMLTKLAPP